MASYEKKTPGVTDRGENTHLQRGRQNRMVNVTLPAGASVSDMPTVWTMPPPSVSESPTDEYDVSLEGTDAKTQFGSGNEMINYMYDQSALATGGSSLSEAHRETRHGYDSADIEHGVPTSKSTSSSSAPAFQQITIGLTSHHSNAFNIQVSQSYNMIMEDEMKTKGGSFPIPIVQLQWSSSMPPEYTPTTWELSGPISLKSYLICMARDLMSPLRALVAEMFSRYGAELLNIAVSDRQGLQFVFGHLDVSHAREMVKDKGRVHALLQQVFQEQDGGDVDFSLKATTAESGSYIPQSDQVNDSQADDTNSFPSVNDTKHPSDLVAIGLAIQALSHTMEDNYKELARQMNIMRGDIQQLKSKKTSTELQMTPKETSGRTGNVGDFPTEEMSVTGFQAFAHNKHTIEDPKIAYTNIESVDLHDTSVKEVVPPSLTARTESFEIIKQNEAHQSGADHRRDVSLETAVWEWKNHDGVWTKYDERQTEKLNKDYARNPKGTCLIQKEGESFRVKFKGSMEEKSINNANDKNCVRRKVTSEELTEIPKQREHRE